MWASTLWLGRLHCIGLSPGTYRHKQIPRLLAMFPLRSLCIVCLINVIIGLRMDFSMKLFLLCDFFFLPKAIFCEVVLVLIWPQQKRIGKCFFHIHDDVSSQNGRGNEQVHRYANSEGTDSSYGRTRFRSVLSFRLKIWSQIICMYDSNVWHLQSNTNA